MKNEEELSGGLGVYRDADRDAFEKLVECWTGSDMAYHKRSATTGLEFAWFCFQTGRNKLDEMQALEEEITTMKETLKRYREALIEIEEMANRNADQYENHFIDSRWVRGKARGALQSAQLGFRRRKRGKRR